MRAALFASVLLVLFAATPAEALRCGNRLVTEGALSTHILKICGEPAATRSWIEVQVRTFYYGRHGRRHNQYRHIGAAGLPVEVIVEEWTYNLGSRRFMRVLRFENGFLVRITAGRYGHAD